MDFSNMSAEEAFSWLVKTVKEGGEVTLDMINGTMSDPYGGGKQPVRFHFRTYCCAIIKL